MAEPGQEGTPALDGSAPTPRPTGDGGPWPTSEPEAALTGDAVVDAALADLDALPPDAPLVEHVRVLDEVHQALQQRLSATQA